MHVSTLAKCSTLLELLRSRSELHPDRPAATFVHEEQAAVTLTYGGLWNRCCEVAAHLRQHLKWSGNASDQRPRVLLVYPAGLEFLPAFFGAQLAGCVPVPTSYPRPNRPMPRVNSVARDCHPIAILSTGDTIATMDRKHLVAEAAALPMIATDHCGPTSLSGECFPELSGETIALLQYTSGSTSEPKGVVVSHRNIMANVAAIVRGFNIVVDDRSDRDATVSASWLPFFHDMGLIGGVISPLYSGYHAVFISPQSFVQRPIRWLKLVSDYQAAVSGGPNFAYELCADRIAPSQVAQLDLRSLRVAFCGAEPILARSLQSFVQRFSTAGFRESAFYPCYGLAEATLLVAGGDGPNVPTAIQVDRNTLRQSRIQLVEKGSRQPATTLVSNGAAAQGTKLKIVDPDNLTELPEGQIGEIWLAGESMTAGYWNRPDENARLFGQLQAASRTNFLDRWLPRKATATITEPEEHAWLRTGDLGFLWSKQLYVTGRLKDIVIIRGRNYAPQDIEQTVLEIGTPLQGRAVAVSIDGPRSEGLAVVAEVSRELTDREAPHVVRTIRRAVISEHEVDPRLVILARPGTIPVTTSGKVQRAATRAALLDGTFQTKYRWERSGGAESPPLPMPDLPSQITIHAQPEIEAAVQTWLRQWLISRLGIEPSELDDHRRFDDFGLDSLAAVELSGELEDWSGAELASTHAWEKPTIASLASLITNQLIAQYAQADTSLSATSLSPGIASLSGVSD